jgi:hypothetical protein
MILVRRTDRAVTTNFPAGESRDSVFSENALITSTIQLTLVIQASWNIYQQFYHGGNI